MEIEEFQPFDFIYKKGDVGRSGHLLRLGPKLWDAQGIKNLTWMCRSARCSTDPGYVLLSGMAIAETDAAEANNLLKRSSRNEINITPGDFFGEHTMLWGFRRRMNVRTLTKTVVGKMKRDVYFNVVTRSAMHERSKREKYLRTGVPMFETFDDECIAKIADIMEKRSFRPGQKIVQQGDEGSEFFIVLKGECVASIRVAKVGCDGFDEHPVRYYSKGERFGELAFINRTPRAATVTATSNAQLLCLDRIVFERVVGALAATSPTF